MDSVNREYIWTYAIIQSGKNGGFSPPSASKTLTQIQVWQSYVQKSTKMKKNKI